MQQRTTAFGGTLLKLIYATYNIVSEHTFTFFLYIGAVFFWGSFFNAGTNCRFRTISFRTIKQYNTVLNKKTV